MGQAGGKQAEAGMHHLNAECEGLLHFLMQMEKLEYLAQQDAQGKSREQKRQIFAPLLPGGIAFEDMRHRLQRVTQMASEQGISMDRPDQMPPRCAQAFGFLEARIRRRQGDLHAKATPMQID